jgi:Glycosyl hydrolases family 38 N-terminal domain.
VIPINLIAVPSLCRFIYVETAFWWKWWMKQHDSVRHQVKKLVNNGQLEFIGGGWSMNDEAVTNYQSTIDQLTWGFRWVLLATLFPEAESNYPFFLIWTRNIIFSLMQSYVVGLAVSEYMKGDSSLCFCFGVFLFL